MFHPDKAPELFLNEIGVIERLRRVGAGLALLDELELLGKELGCETIWVLTDEGNAAAMGMYAKAGGTWNGERHVMFEYDLTPSRPGPRQGRGQRRSSVGHDSTGRDDHSHRRARCRT
ncbi:MAG: GNAT family N-acetyltransferase [Actinomycetota bacterium]